MRPTWLIPVATALIGSGGIGTWLGLWIRRQQNRATEVAAAVASAIAGLTAVSTEQRAELDRLYKQLDAREKRITTLENATRRRPR